MTERSLEPSDEFGPMAAHLLPLVGQSDRKHRSRGVKVEPALPSLAKPPAPKKRRGHATANPAPKRYGGRYLVGFNGKSFPKPRIRRRKKR